METKLFTITVCNTKRAYLPELAAKGAIDSRVQSAMSVTNLIRKIQEDVGTTLAPTPPSQDLLVTPGTFCTPAGAIGQSSSGVVYTCKTSVTDKKNRWRR
jgi:hypothetical protein